METRPPTVLFNLSSGVPADALEAAHTSRFLRGYLRAGAGQIKLPSLTGNTGLWDHAGPRQLQNVHGRDSTRETRAWLREGGEKERDSGGEGVCLLPASARRRHRLCPWVRKIPWRSGILWCVCVKNPTDRGAWRATVRGAAKSQTRLRD